MAASDKASKMRLLAFTEADAETLTRILREEFPCVHFVKFHYSDEDIGRVGPHRSQPERFIVPYYETLADPDERYFLVWLEPSGWKPKWEGPNSEGVYVIANRPRLQFTFERSGRVPPDYLNLLGGRIWAYYLKDDKEHLRFLNKVWRIVAKLSTNVLDILDRKTGEVMRPAQRTIVWTGPDANDWCRADPRRRIDGNLRPVNDPAEI